MFKIFIYSKDKNYLAEIKAALSSKILYEIEIESFENGSNFYPGKYDLCIIHIDTTENSPVLFLNNLKIDPKSIKTIVIIESRHLLYIQDIFNMGIINVHIHTRNQDTGGLIKTINALIENSDTIKKNLELSLRQDKEIEKFKQKYIFRSPGSLSKLKDAYIASESGGDILLLGETGVGKEIFAELIHKNTPKRNENKIIAINCAHLNKETAYSEIFGYKKGSFSNAESDTDGYLQKANNNTLFLDEIGELPPDVQSEFYRLLQGKGTKREFYRKGSTELESSDVRIIAATNSMSEDEDKNKKALRISLLNRFIWEIKIPPLRERKEEIPLLVKFFIDKMNNDRTKGKNTKIINDVSNEALKILLNYDYPGNIRELDNIVYRAYSRCKTSQIESCDLDLVLQNKPSFIN